MSNQAPQHYLSNDEIRSAAPSIFAERAYADVSDRYTFIPTSNVLTGLRKEGFEVVRAAETKSRALSDKAGFTKHVMRLRRNTDLIVNDVIPEIVITNSHDGTGAYKVMTGLYRVLCSNGLVTCDTSMGEVRVSHKGDVVGRVIEGVYEVVDRFQMALETRERWSQIRLDRAERLALANSATLLKWPVVEVVTNNDVVSKPQTVRVFEHEKLLEPRREADRSNDLWTTFNVIQENLIRGGLTYSTVSHQGKLRRGTTKAVRSAAQDLKLNQALWSLGLETEKLLVAA